MLYPTDLKYSKSHEWVKMEDGVAVIGISDFAQDALGDVVFVNLPGEGDDVTCGDAFGDVESVTVQKDTISDLGLPYPDCVTLLLRHKGGVQGVLAADVVSRKAVRSFECFGDGIHLFWEGNPKALYEFKDGDKQPVNTYASFEHDSRYSDNIVENAYVDELTNFFGVLKGEESPKWSFEKDLKAIALMDRIENS